MEDEKELETQPTDKINPQNPNQKLGSKSNSTDNFMEDDSLPDAAKEYIRKLRAEAADNRTKYNSVNTKLTELETAANKEKEQKLAEAGEYQKLYEASKQELDTLKTEVNTLKELSTIVEDMVKDSLKSLPKSIINLMPEGLNVIQQLKWVNKAKDVQLDVTEDTKKSNKLLGDGNHKGPNPVIVTPKDEAKSVYDIERAKRANNNQYAM